MLKVKWLKLKKSIFKKYLFIFLIFLVLFFLYLSFRNATKTESVGDNLNPAAMKADEKEISEIDYALEFNKVLRQISAQQSYQEKLALLNGERLKKELKGIRYIVITKSNPACSFPEAYLAVQGHGEYEQIKGFDSFEVSPEQRLYFIASNPADDDIISNVYFYRYKDSPDDCKEYEVSFFVYDYSQNLKKFKQESESYVINIKDDDYKTLLDAIPTPKERYRSDFRFPYVDGQFLNDNQNYSIKIKNRGGTLFHWANEKKSYTVKFQDWYKNNEKLLFYIPEKRAYSGEYLINKLSGILELESLESGFGRLTLNDKDYGAYYVSEDFDKLFLAKRVMPEANVYNTDPYKITNSDFKVDSLTKEMFLSTINDYQENFDHDIDYFLSSVKLDDEQLKQEWIHHFNPDNLSKILALCLLTGTAHYDSHNIVFYVNPADGRIYFFPWDLMNYTHAGDLNRDDLKNINNDYLNVNEIFSKLTEISAIRDERNKVIYRQADELIAYLDNFYKGENIALFANFLTDPTVEFYGGDGNRPMLVSLFKIPKTIKNNIVLLKDKISKTEIQGFIIKTVSDENQYGQTINLKSETFSSQRINKLIINNLRDNHLTAVKVNGQELDSEQYAVANLENRRTEITFLAEIKLSPKLNYQEVYGAPIKLEPTFARIDLTFAKPISLELNLTVNVENVSTDEKKDFLLSHQEVFIPVSITKGTIVETVANNSEFKNDLLIKIADNDYHFISDHVEIKEDLIIPQGIKLTIMPGTKIKLAPGKSIISYGEINAVGAEERPIIFTRLDSDKPWGVVGLVHETAEGYFAYCLFEGGKDAKIDNKYFSGMLSGYYTKVSIKNCRFQYASADDSINLKNGVFTIEGSVFYKNSFDAIDFDVAQPGSLVRGNYFYGNGNDGLDVSGSNVVIENNRIVKSGDKGISVGEKSTIIVKNNILEKGNFGLAVKDSSAAELISNDIIGNNVGVAAYNKKEIFGGSAVKVYNSVFKRNRQDFGIEVISESDFRSRDQNYQSTGEVYNSRYVLSRRHTQEIIRAPKETAISKRKLFKAYLTGQLADYGFKFAILSDRASTGQRQDNPYDDQRIGADRRLIKMSD